MPLSNQRAFRHIVLSAMIAGLITGVLVTLLQMFTTVPLIAKAEMYEQGAITPEASAPTTAMGVDAAQDHGDRDHGAAAWKPKDGVERIFYTGVTTVLVAIGYALLLGACLSQMRAAGWRSGLAFAVAGFLVFQLAPALGLPPEPPGSPQADLGARQLWWIGAAMSTALALGSWLYARSQSKVIWIPVGIVLLLLPHVIGAPQAIEGQVSVIPPELARRFTTAALFTAAVFWLALGVIQGYVFGRLGQREALD